MIRVFHLDDYFHGDIPFEKLIPLGNSIFLSHHHHRTEVEPIKTFRNLEHDRYTTELNIDPRMQSLVIS